MTSAPCVFCATPTEGRFEVEVGSRFEARPVCDACQAKRVEAGVTALKAAGGTLAAMTGGVLLAIVLPVALCLGGAGFAVYAFLVRP